MNQGKAHNQRKDACEPRKKTLGDRVAGILGVPSDAVGLSNGFMAEMRGRCGVSVRGCRRILSYSRREIRLDTRDGAVSVLGADLFCTAYCADTVGIEGRIDAVLFEDGVKASSNLCCDGEGGKEQ